MFERAFDKTIGPEGLNKKNFKIRTREIKSTG